MGAAASHDKACFATGNAGGGAEELHGKEDLLRIRLELQFCIEILGVNKYCTYVEHLFDRGIDETTILGL